MKAIFPEQSLIPVVAIEEVSHAVPLAEALLAGGITTIEITLRTKAGLPAIEAVSKALPDMLVGSGTVLEAAHMQAAHDAGARFHVSPGLTESLANFANEKALHWLPGVATASEVMRAMEHGYTYLKLYPAGILGGTALLKQFAPLFPAAHFCPTGGVSIENMPEFAAQPNVFAMGGSWLAPKATMQAGDWDAITQIARKSVSALQNGH